MNALVCIIIVNYNGKQDTLECIQSINECTYPNYKIIVVDNGSDESPALKEIVSASDNCEVVVSAMNLGFAGANNLGIEMALLYKPAYIVLLNNDTVVTPNFLEQLIGAYQENEDIGIVTGKIYYYDNPEALWFGGSYYDDNRYEMKIDGLGKKDGPGYSKRKIIPFATCCLWLMPVETIEKIGKMCEEYFLYYEDADYCVRIGKAGLKIIYEPNAIIYHKESRSTKKGSRAYQYYNTRNYLMYIKRYCERKYRLKAYVRQFFYDLKEIIRGRLECNVVFKAWRDFMMNKHGMMKYKSNIL